MTNYHIFEQSGDCKTVSVVFHIPTPVLKNDANIDYKSAIVASFAKDGVTIGSQVPGITVEELNKIKSGEIVEVEKTIRYSILGLTATQKIAEIDVTYKDLVEYMSVKIEDKYLLYGTAKDIIAAEK